VTFVQQPVYLTRQEAADYARLSLSTIKRALRAGELHAVGSRGRVRIRPEWVEAWLERRNDRLE
jgi:excisionase family DNA binding protein